MSEQPKATNDDNYVMSSEGDNTDSTNTSEQETETPKKQEKTRLLPDSPGTNDLTRTQDKGNHIKRTKTDNTLEITQTKENTKK